MTDIELCMLVSMYTGKKMTLHGLWIPRLRRRINYLVPFMHSSKSMYFETEVDQIFLCENYM